MKTRGATYSSWANMRTRCNNPQSDRYRFYGERGIACCERWAVFEAFLADMGERPPGTTLDRIVARPNIKHRAVKAEGRMAA